MARLRREQNFDYRKDEVSLIMSRWASAESCSLVGVGSIGKSNLLQHLANPKIQTAYMKLSNTDHFEAITIDPSMLTPLPTTGQADDSQIRCWAGYELILHRLYMAFYQSDALNQSEKQDLQDAYLRLQDGNNPLYAYMGLRYLELGLDIVLSKDIQVVFMFDEFEEMLKNLPVKFFLTLRGLRDANKKQLSYLTFTRSPIVSLLNQFQIDQLGIEQFIELFTDNIFYIGPYSDSDARRMVSELAHRQQHEKIIDDYAITFLVWSTGGFAGLLRAALRMLSQFDGDRLNSSTIMTKNDQLAQELALAEPVQTECETIWQSLTEPEQYILKVAVGIEKYAKSDENISAAALLKRKKLLAIDKDDPGELTISPPLLLYYIRNAFGDGQATTTGV